MNTDQVAYLGPAGTYAHNVAQQRYPEADLVPQISISDVFEYVESHRDRCPRGIVPIENSSGGTIVETIDLLISPRASLVITEGMSLDVKLALLGHDHSTIRTVYSHFAPFHHCESWLRAKLPGVTREVVASTGEAARLAAADDTGAALASRANASIYGLDVLEYPVEPDVRNVTQFVVVSRREEGATSGGKTSLAIDLPNKPGALHAFLQPFSANNINLTRIVSRPVHGQPNTYTFFVELDGSTHDESVAAALYKVRKKVSGLRVVGEYDAKLHYTS